MRLHPAASGRQERIVPAGGRTFSGVYLPARTVVIGPTLVLHHDPDVFPEPLEWRPERWLEAERSEAGLEKEKRKRMLDSYVPFGHGARICIGQHLAMMELRLLTAAIYDRFSTEISATSTDEDMHQLGALAAVPKGLRCELFVKERKGREGA
jgi:cytochrome P450